MIGWIYSQKDKEFTFVGAFLIALVVTIISGILFSLAINKWMIERVDAEIRAEFTASKFTFTTNHDIRLNSIKFQSLQVNDFSNVTLYPLPVEKNDSRFNSIRFI
jgi:hypothetical protein